MTYRTTSFQTVPEQKKWHETYCDQIIDLNNYKVFYIDKFDQKTFLVVAVTDSAMDCTGVTIKRTDNYDEAKLYLDKIFKELTS